jgi:hypothetical protein
VSPVQFRAHCPGCGRDVLWTAIPSYGTCKDPGGQPRYRIDCRPCNRQTPYLTGTRSSPR